LPLYIIEKKDNQLKFGQLQGDAETRREELIKNIEMALDKLSLSELEAISYDLFTKGYMD
jgi:hypothetical protein